jgi:DNA-binding transcriptional LysR family regulator
MKRHVLLLNALRAFEAAGRHGQMTAAAAELGVTISAVSRQIANLEASLGVPLFEGAKNALRLTSVGRAMLPQLTVAFDQLELAVQTIVDPDEGVLDVSTIATFTMRWLIPRLERFQTANPAIEVRLSTDDGPVDFLRSHCDVALRVGRPEDDPKVETFRLFPEYVGLVMTPALAKRFDATRSLAGMPLLQTRTRPNSWREWCGLTGFAAYPDASGEYEHYYYMLEATVSGLGVCIAPWQMVWDDIQSGKLVAPCGFVRNANEYFALRRRHSDRKSKTFCIWLANEARNFPLPLDARGVGGASR